MPMGLVIITVLVGAFILTHLGFSISSVRDAIVSRLGSVKFTVLYSLVAWAVLGAMLAGYVAYREQSPSGLGLADLPGIGPTATIAMGLGMVLMISIVGPTGYLRSAVVVFSEHTAQPRGMERITRHPFFVGLALLCVGHILVAPRLAGVIVFGGFGLLAVVGGPMQDRKLRARRGPEHAAYLDATSIVPFGAVLRGRQRVVWGELPWLFLALGVAMVWGTRALHGTGYGAWLVMAALVVGPTWFAIASAFRHHRARSH